jgi:hypothetical protein
VSSDGPDPLVGHGREPSRWGPRGTQVSQIPIEGPIRRPERGGSDWDPIKNIIQRENSAYVTNSQPSIPTRVCQCRVVTTDLPTLGTNLKQYQSENESQEAKDLATLHSTRRTVCDPRVDSP